MSTGLKAQNIGGLGTPVAPGLGPRVCLTSSSDTTLWHCSFEPHHIGDGVPVAEQLGPTGIA